MIAAFRRGLALVALASLGSACGARGQGAQAPGEFSPIQPFTPTPDAEFRNHPPALASARLLRPPQVVTRQLSNGLVLWLVSRPDLPVVTVLYANRAAMDTESRTAGLAGLVAETVALTGSHHPWEFSGLSSFTFGDGSMLRARVAREELAATIARFAGAVRHPVFDDEHVEFARRRAAARAWSIGRNEQASVRRLVMSSLYGSDHLLALPASTVSASIRARTSQEISGFYAQRYTPSQSAIIIVGALDEAEAEREVRRGFEDWRASVAPVAPLGAPALAQAPASAIGIDRDEGRAFIAVGLPCAGSNDPDNIVFDVLASMLDKGLGSRAALALRQGEGNPYAIDAECRERAQSGDFTVEFDVEPGHAAESLTEVLSNLRRLGAEPSPAEEIAAAGRARLGQYAARFQSNALLALALGSLFVRRLPANYYDTLEDRVLTIRPDDIRRVATKYFGKTSPRVAVYGSAKTLGRLGGSLPIEWRKQD